MMRKPTQLNGTFKFNANIGSKFRIHPRVQLDGEVIIHDENRLYITSLNNISAGGVFVDNLTSIAQGRIVRVVIRSSRFKKPVQAKGTVVRIEDSKRRGLAIEFSILSSEAKTAIQQCVSETRMETALKVA
jgi:PilZ domain